MLFCLQLLAHPMTGDDWEEGLGEVQMTPDGNIMQIRASADRHALPGISEEDADVNDVSEEGDRINGLEI